MDPGRPAPRPRAAPRRGRRARELARRRAHRERALRTRVRVPARLRARRSAAAISPARCRSRSRARTTRPPSARSPSSCAIRSPPSASRTTSSDAAITCWCGAHPRSHRQARARRARLRARRRGHQGRRAPRGRGRRHRRRARARGAGAQGSDARRAARRARRASCFATARSTPPSARSRRCTKAAPSDAPRSRSCSPRSIASVSRRRASRPSRSSPRSAAPSRRRRGPSRRRSRCARASSGATRSFARSRRRRARACSSASTACASERVAVKIFAGYDARGGGRDALARFEREVRVLGTLDHPNIVPLRDYVPEGPALVLAWMGRGTLEHMIAAEPLAPARAVEIAQAVLAALGEAHRLGVIHRDIKPANVLFDDAGVTRLGDFGVAHLSDLSATATAGVIGTLGYMSPEQREGRPASVRSDIYGVGAMLWEMLTGERPDAGELRRDDAHAPERRPSRPRHATRHARALVPRRGSARPPRGRLRRTARARRAQVAEHHRARRAPRVERQKSEHPTALRLAPQPDGTAIDHVARSPRRHARARCAQRSRAPRPSRAPTTLPCRPCCASIATSERIWLAAPRGAPLAGKLDADAGGDAARCARSTPRDRRDPRQRRPRARHRRRERRRGPRLHAGARRRPRRPTSIAWACSPVATFVRRQLAKLAAERPGVMDPGSMRLLSPCFVARALFRLGRVRRVRRRDPAREDRAGRRRLRRRPRPTTTAAAVPAKTTSLRPLAGEGRASRAGLGYFLQNVTVEDYPVMHGEQVLRLQDQDASTPSWASICSPATS